MQESLIKASGEQPKEDVVNLSPLPRILILGVGNLLLTDDGFGVHVINALRQTEFPNNIMVMEAGTVSHQLIPLLHEIDHLIVIDVVEAGDQPGALFRFSPTDLRFATEPQISLHQISLNDVLQMAALTGHSPETIIIAAQPKDTTSWSLELSDELRRVVPRVRELALEEAQKRAV